MLNDCSWLQNVEIRSMAVSLQLSAFPIFRGVAIGVAGVPHSQYLHCHQIYRTSIILVKVILLIKLYVCTIMSYLLGNWDCALDQLFSLVRPCLLDKYLFFVFFILIRFKIQTIVIENKGNIEIHNNPKTYI